MGYGSFFFGAAVVLILLAFGIGTLSYSRFWPAAWCPRLANTAQLLRRQLPLQPVRGPHVAGNQKDLDTPR